MDKPITNEARFERLVRLLRKKDETIAACEQRVTSAMAVLTCVGGQLFFLDDDDYPQRLKKLPKPPPVVFVRGALAPQQTKTVAIVGARAAYATGIRTATELANKLANEGIATISGGALGIDAAAHRGSLEANGHTTAVLGTGLDLFYPPRNRDLLITIAKRGALITPFPPGTPVRRPHFPRRNALLAALADVVVVVEAQRRSGSLNTAGWAERIGVPFAAYPHSPGGQIVVARGGFTVRTASDVIALLRENKLPENVQEPLLPPENKHLLELVRSGRNTSIEDLAHAAGWSYSKTATVALTLEIEGLISQLPTGDFVPN